MDDLISRRVAVEAVSNLASSMSVCLNIDECHGMKRMQEMAVVVLRGLQSAEPQWIPISERMPEDEGWYLVTDDSGGVLWLEVEHYDPESGLKPFCTIQNPVAWMRCPDPYGGEQE